MQVETQAILFSLKNLSYRQRLVSLSISDWSNETNATLCKSECLKLKKKKERNKTDLIRSLFQYAHVIDVSISVASD